MFDELRLLQVEHTVRASFLELYNEEIFDLLSSSEELSQKSLRWKNHFISFFFNNILKIGINL